MFEEASVPAPGPSEGSELQHRFSGLSTPEIFKSGELIGKGRRDVTVGV